MITLTKDIDEHFYISENGVILEIALEETVLPATVPQIQDQVSKESHIGVFNIN